MKLTLQALFVAAVAAFTLNVQAAESKYDQCVADGDTIVKLAREKGATAHVLTSRKQLLVSVLLS